MWRQTVRPKNTTERNRGVQLLSRLDQKPLKCQSANGLHKGVSNVLLRITGANRIQIYILLFFQSLGVASHKANNKLHLALST